MLWIGGNRMRENYRVGERACVFHREVERQR